MNTEIKAIIERLIELENSPVERGRLLVLLQISNTISDINDKNLELEKKIISAGEYIQQNRRASDRYAGAKKVLIAFAVVVQVIGGYYINQILEFPKKVNADYLALERRVFVIEQHIQLQQKPVPLP